MLLTLLTLAMKPFAAYGSVGHTLVEKKSKGKVFEMRVSVEKRLTECGIFASWRRHSESHEGVVYFDNNVNILTDKKKKTKSDCVYMHKNKCDFAQSIGNIKIT